jgi:hypothetical protein
MSWLEKLRTRWGLANLGQVIIVLLVFACTGFTVLFLKKPLFYILGIEGKLTGTFGTALYLLAVLPLYQVLLLGYGFIFGQFRFFWEFEKKMLRRMKIIK